MQQVKTFTFRIFPSVSADIEKEVNSWLSENPLIRVIFFNNAIVRDDLIVSILYEGELGKGVTDLKY